MANERARQGLGAALADFGELSRAKPVAHPLKAQSAQQKRPAGNRSRRFSAAFFVCTNVRLIATMRSRSKKGEAGLCCAQPCDRPGPIVTMVLPTDFQPEFDLLSRRSRVSSSAAYCIDSLPNLSSGESDDTT